jgi:DNA topoisomerase I
MKLLIVESPGKVKSIQSYVGNDFIVKASVGHCFQIEPSDKTINKFLETNELNYVVIDKKQSVVDEIKMLSQKSDEVVIATDNDREGEAIGWDIAYRAVSKKCKIKRITFCEITKTAILKALKESGELNEHLYNAQQARAILDLIVGYKVSPILWRKVCQGTSAGRVQSIGLFLIVERQKEIDAFVPEEYWDITGFFVNSKKTEFKALYKCEEKLCNEATVNKYTEKINKAKSWKIESIEKTSKKRSPSPIFNTSSLQQFGSAVFGWDGKKTMSRAQALYEGYSIQGHESTGLISYHRTDSVNIAEEALSGVRKFISDEFGKKYLSPKPIIYKSKNKNAQEAHEGIRPTHLEFSLSDIKQSIPEDDFKLYEAIWSRFVSCQMSDAEFDATKITICSDNKQVFTSSGQTLVFDGFLKVWKYSDVSEEQLPELNESEKVNLSKIEPKQHFTKPPAHFNTATLVKTLEEESIGRPSTYASIVDTLLKRSYVVKEGKAFAPTEIGKKVCEFLKNNFQELMNVNYTARIEEQLDEIAEGSKEWKSVVTSFFSELDKRLQAAKTVKKEKEISEHVCPVCNTRKLVKRFGRFGSFYGCDGYPDCTGMFKIGPNGEPIAKEKKVIEYLEGKTCECGAKLAIRSSNRTGKKFAGCSSFPKCRNLYDLEGKKIEPKFKRFKKKEAKS